MALCSPSHLNCPRPRSSPWHFITRNSEASQRRPDRQASNRFLSGKDWRLKASLRMAFRPASPVTEPTPSSRIRVSQVRARAISSAQLRLWREKRRVLVGASAIMAPIAERLSDEQIEAVAAFYAGAAQQAGLAMKRLLAICAHCLTLTALAACNETQSALSPHGRDAERIATLTWVLFGMVAAVMGLVLAGTWFAIRGSNTWRTHLSSERSIIL